MNARRFGKGFDRYMGEVGLKVRKEGVIRSRKALQEWSRAILSQAVQKRRDWLLGILQHGETKAWEEKVASCYIVPPTKTPPGTRVNVPAKPTV